MTRRYHYCGHYPRYRLRSPEQEWREHVTLVVVLLLSVVAWLVASSVDLNDHLASLRRGDHGRTVVLLQKRLHDLGFYRGAFDGCFDSGLEESVRSFQREHYLEIDGLVGPFTWRQLMRAYSGHRLRSYPSLPPDELTMASLSDPSIHR